MIEFFVHYFFNTLNMIDLFVLVGMGIAMISGIMDVMNLAHGGFIIIGAYTLFFVQSIGGSFLLGDGCLLFCGISQPVASIPCGLTSAGLPVGLQIVGPLYRDDLVLRASRAYEAARGDFPLPSLVAVK